MTPYGPPVTLAPVPGRTLLRVLLATELVLAGLAGAALAAFAAHVAGTGCFIGCDPESRDPQAAALLWALAVVLLVAGPVLARVVWRSRSLTVWAGLLLGVPAALWLTGALGAAL